MAHPLARQRPRAAGGAQPGVSRGQGRGHAAGQPDALLPYTPALSSAALWLLDAGVSCVWYPGRRHHGWETGRSALGAGALQTREELEAMPDVAIRQQFPLGCRVRFSAAGLRSWCPRPDVVATVVGYFRNGDGLYIIRDGNTTREDYNALFLERYPEDLGDDRPPTAARCQCCGTRFTYLRPFPPRRYCSVPCRHRFLQRAYAARKKARHASTT